MNQLTFSIKKVRGTFGKLTTPGLYEPVSTCQWNQSIHIYIFFPWYPVLLLDVLAHLISNLFIHSYCLIVAAFYPNTHTSISTVPSNIFLHYKYSYINILFTKCSAPPSLRESYVKLSSL